MFTHSARRPHGTLIVTDPELGERQMDSLRCVHCQTCWIVQKGSGARRGFCRCCMGPTCGNPACDTCEHWEKKLDRLEREKAQEAERALARGGVLLVPVP